METRDEIAAELTANPHEADNIALTQIRTIMRPGTGLSTGGRLAAINAVLAALDAVRNPAAVPAPPAINPLASEEATREAFRRGHLEDDKNEWGTR